MVTLEVADRQRPKVTLVRDGKGQVLRRCAGIARESVQARSQGRGANASAIVGEYER